MGEARLGINLDPKTGLDERAVTVLRGIITHVCDGDTIEINEIPVCISALDCPENTTSEGKSATRFAKRFQGKQAICELTGAKTYDKKWDIAQLMTKTLQGLWSRTRLVLIGANMMYGVGIAKSRHFYRQTIYN